MSTNFPTSIDSYPTRVDNVDDVMASHVNNLQDAIVAIETAVIAQSPNTNILSDTLTQDLWSDVADVGDAVLVTKKWYALWSGNAPDITGITPSGAMTKAAKNMKITVDTNGTQFGIVQFIPYSATVQLRGKTVSFSIDAQGFNVSAMRMAILSWTSTANAYTVDVVSSWAATPTWATNYTSINTPANIALSGSASVPDRLELEGVVVPDTANNLAIVVWTPNSENNGDYVVLARAKLEIGQLATAFVGVGIEQERVNSGDIDAIRVSKLVASDGSPDPALSANAAGAVTAAGALTVNGLLTAAAALTIGAGDLTISSGNYNNTGGVTYARQLVGQRNIGIGDDTVRVMPVMAAGNRYLFILIENNGGYFLGINAYNSIITISASSIFNVVAGSGALSGTTGTDGKINIRDNAGALNIENRTGSSGLNVGWTAFGSD